MNSQIQFWASGNNYQKRNSNSGKCKRGHVLLFTSHQIFREKFPIQGDGSTFFGKCTLTHSYETKAVLLQEHILQSWYHTRKAECLLNLDRNSFRKKKSPIYFNLVLKDNKKKIDLVPLVLRFVYPWIVFYLPWGPLLQRLNISNILPYQRAFDLIGLGAWWKALNKLKSGAKWHLILTIL